MNVAILGICVLLSSLSRFNAEPMGPRTTFTAMQTDNMPSPFQRFLKKGDKGQDVRYLQLFLSRGGWTIGNLTGEFDDNTELIVKEFQVSIKAEETGIVRVREANHLLEKFTNDKYEDTGFTAASMGFKYKIVVPVHSNRSIETDAILFDANNNILLKFRVRGHGHSRPDGAAWPEFNNTDTGLNEFTSSGATPTGLMTLDMNLPESNHTIYGPYPINRVVNGLEGNAKEIIRSYGTGLRGGILLHTGRWPGWKVGKDMPNSAGCMHAHPEAINAIWHLLRKHCGVVINDNTQGEGSTYPYKPQGILVVYQVD